MLQLFDASPTCDGAAAVILVNAKKYPAYSNAGSCVELVSSAAATGKSLTQLTAGLARLAIKSLPKTNVCEMTLSSPPCNDFCACLQDGSFKIAAGLCETEAFVSLQISFKLQPDRIRSSSGR